MEKEYQDVKYIRELTEYWIAYMNSAINEIYVGVGINLGMSEKDAYKMIQNNPKELSKAKFFKNIFNKFKNIFKKKIPKFRFKKKRIIDKGNPMTPEEWDIFNNSLDNYWQDIANKITGDISTKAYLFGKETTEFRKKNKPYKNKSLYQVIEDQFDGDMPEEIENIYKKYDFSKSEKKAFNKVYNKTALYVTEANNNIKEAIRQQVQQGLEDEKSNIEIASDLYWNVEKDEKMLNKYSAETMRRNWFRVATTEMSTIYEAGILAPYEAEAMESMQDPKKAQYFVRTGGTCSWCKSKQGTIVRLVPNEIVIDSQNESLKSMGIKDPNTDIAIWVGKNNVGIRKQDDWLVACPAHPFNVATFQPIDLENEFYNPKTENIEKRQKKEKYIPQLKEYSETSKEEQEYNKPVFIDKNLVRFNDNVYESVSSQDYADKKMKWDKDPSLPIPVDMNSTSYEQIFGEAKKK